MILFTGDYRYTGNDQGRLVSDLLGAIRLGLTVTVTTVDVVGKGRCIRLIVTPGHEEPRGAAFDGDDLKHLPATGTA
jgi:hypothetical protein